MAKTLGSPSIYVVIEEHGDGYGHNSFEVIAWFHHEGDATSYCNHKAKDASWDTSYRYEEVPHGPDEW